MNSKLSQPWIKMDNIAAVVQLEPALVILGLLLLAFIIYKFFLGAVSVERHRNLRRQFQNISSHTFFAAAQFATFWILQKNVHDPDSVAARIIPYTGLIAILWWSIVFIKISRILILEYLFLGHMKVGVPQLLVNLFSLLVSLVIASWAATQIFEMRLEPLLATSALLSVVLGLALQDTLGNLFAGVALQMDKPYEIGHWIEIVNGSQKTVGQVYEISWRSTILVSMGDELITIPNRVMSNSQVSNFSAKNRPFVRSQIFRLPLNTDLDLARRALMVAADRVKGVLRMPEPVVLVSETTESWLTLKVIYYISDYGSQILIGDRVLSESVQELRSQGLELEAPRLKIIDSPSAQA